MKTIDKILCASAAVVLVGIAVKVARKRGVVKW